MEHLFLLGGGDLEMQIIRKLLEQHKVGFYDKQLQWSNATVDAYRQELERYGNQPGIHIYGIELRFSGDLPMYNNYTLVDHHNEYAGRPAALTQVAALLKISLSRYEQLVAANDSCYIPGMLALHATADEIARIRRADRAAQGVTEEDELQALEAISRKVVYPGGLQVVYSGSGRFSPVCNRLYPYESLLVYTDSEWMYSGKI
ncbi:MAG: hypothetical protein LUD02_02735 [Tannerellaceae bacterium]|nr:hypothetical protein [Tannerellaceae bacterium]